MNKHFQLAALPLACILALPVMAQVKPDAGQTLQQLTPSVSVPTPAGATVQVQTPAAAEMLPGGQTVELSGITISGATVLTQDELLFSLGNFLGQRYDMAGLRGLALKISNRYREAGYPFARAFIPPQSLSGGALVIEVIEGRYGRVQTTGDESLTAAAAAYFVPLASGQVIESGLLERITLLVDDLPGVAITPVMKPGEQVGTGDLDVKVERSKPQEFEVGLDNHGNYYSGEWRARASAVLNSPFLLGDKLSASALYSEENLWLVNVNYAAPLGIDGWRANVGYAQTSYALGNGFEGNEGTAKVSSAGASYPIIRSQQTNINATVSVQHKALFNENTEVPDSGESYDVLAVPLVVQFDHRDTLGGGAITFGSLTWTQGDLDRSAETSGNAQPGQFAKWGLDLIRLQSLGGGRLSAYARLSAQMAQENLDSSEKMSLGGPTGVRAYPSGEASGDEGWFTQWELRYNLGEHVPFVFYDHGHISANAQAVDSPEPDQSRAGWGAGTRFNQGPWTAEALVAWRTRGGAPQSVQGKDPKPRFWVNGSYKF